MKFKSINPYSQEVIKEFLSHTQEEQKNMLKKADLSFMDWRKTSIEERSKLIRNAGNFLLENVDKYAEMISREMGKPISESKGEIRKCAWVCEYYAENAKNFLSPKHIETEADKSYVRFDPIGTILGIMPWNFPFWQVFRFAAPTLTAGNTILMKHAPNVFGCSQLIEDVFQEAGYPEGVYQNLIVHHDSVDELIASDAIKAVTLTGSGRAGSTVAASAGKHIKKTVLELGGSNAFIVCDDADMEHTINTAVTARMLNTGQSCIAAKRFLVMEKVYDEFVSGFTKKISKLKSGDPLNEDTEVGVLARQDLADKLKEQIDQSVKVGAKIIQGGKKSGCYIEPTILTEITPEMPVFKEETFGPLSVIIKVKNIEEAFKLSEQTEYGLGLSIFTTNIDAILPYSEIVSDGCFFVNELVKSDPRLPFGGTKKSGYGRELSEEGILEFVNKKTVFIK